MKTKLIWEKVEGKDKHRGTYNGACLYEIVLLETDAPESVEELGKMQWRAQPMKPWIALCERNKHLRTGFFQRTAMGLPAVLKAKFVERSSVILSDTDHEEQLSDLKKFIDNDFASKLELIDKK